MFPFPNRRADDGVDHRVDEAAFQDEKAPLTAVLGDLATVTGLVAVALAIALVWTMGSDFGGSAGALANF